MDKDLKEAFDIITTLRASLQLAYFNRDEIDVNEVDAALNESSKFMLKHGARDDMLDQDYPPEGE